MKKIIFFILIQAIVISGLVFNGSNTETNKQSKFADKYVATETKNDTSPAECNKTETIDYYYYDEKDVNFQSNNKFGIYVYAEVKEYFELAQNLVNSNGGEWGYVLIPYNVKDRDAQKWSRVFEQVSSKKLIPIIKLYDVDLDDYKNQTRDAAEFLNRFLWPIKHRYITVYNEPNDSAFWYSNADPAQYARVLKYTIEEFKKINPDYYMLNGGLNITAPSNSNNIDAFVFMEKMNQEVPGIFEMLDGWASHSYPQPNFSGNPLTIGRWGIRAYEEELRFLKDSLGVQKDLPVFITETGWAHAEGEDYNSSFYTVDVIAEFYKTAYEDVWLKDDKVRAVIPFTIWYEPPFDHFSWVNRDNVPYLQYDVIEDLNKIKGEPPILLKSNVELIKC